MKKKAKSKSKDTLSDKTTTNQFDQQESEAEDNGCEEAELNDDHLGQDKEQIHLLIPSRNETTKNKLITCVGMDPGNRSCFTAYFDCKKMNFGEHPNRYIRRDTEIKEDLKYKDPSFINNYVKVYMTKHAETLSKVEIDNLKAIINSKDINVKRAKLDDFIELMNRLIGQNKIGASMRFDFHYLNTKLNKDELVLDLSSGYYYHTIKVNESNRIIKQDLIKA